jgi:hypothetical protein
MADRILTKGLKTGTGIGGVKWILRRGLSSSVVVITLSQVKFTFVAMNQSKLTDVVLSQSKLTDITVLE